MSRANIEIPVDLTNPGQFFACCGLLELAGRLWPGAEGWFEDQRFRILTPCGGDVAELLKMLASSRVSNTMSPEQVQRLEALKNQRRLSARDKEEKKELESLRRELPIAISGGFTLRIDWFIDEFSGGSRFKTWAGQQSVLDITRAMHAGVSGAEINDAAALWIHARDTGLPFFFDSDLGGQGSALDIGFSFDPLSGSEATRIRGTCRPVLELLAFVGLQRFRPREIAEQNRFIYVAWNRPLPPAVAACAACQAVSFGNSPAFEFRLLYRTKYLKSFLPAIPFQGDHDE